MRGFVVEHYRLFRAEFVEQRPNDNSQETRWTPSGVQKTGQLALGRDRIAAFRRWVAEQAPHLLAVSPQSEALVRRALRISPALSLTPSVWRIVCQWVCFWLPTPWMGLRAHRLLRQAGSFEGRHFLFEHFISRTLPGSALYYEEGLDFGLVHFEAIRTREDLEAFQCRELQLLRLALRLGMRHASELREVFMRGARRHDAALLLILSEEGVISTVEELEWAGQPRSWGSGASLQASELLELRNTVRGLLAHGMARQHVAGVLRHPMHRLNAQRLSDNLTYLQEARVDGIPDLLEQVGEPLWLAPLTTWRYVVEAIGATTAQSVAQFRHLLDCHGLLPQALAQELRAMGADLAALSGCQELISALKDERFDPQLTLGSLRALAAPPHGLDVEQLAQCRHFLRAPNGVAPFLCVLMAHGWGDAYAVLEFQQCFGKVQPGELDRLLKLMGARGRGFPVEQVVAWVLDASTTGCFEAYQYLVDACEIEDLQTLRRALKLLHLGEPFLRHLVEVRCLRTVPALRDWYFNKARGLDGYRSVRHYDAVDRVLLDDAFARKQFNHLAGNQAVVAMVVTERVELALGPLPWPSDEAQREAYWQAWSAQEQQTRAQLLPGLPRVLAATGGALLPSLLRASEEDSDEFKRSLARLTPLLDDLLAGGGPCTPELAPLEAEAVSLVYRTPVQMVQARWSKVQGRVSDWQALQLRSQYPMTWQSARWELGRPLDRSGFGPLLVAAQFAERFSHSVYQTMFIACMGLSPKQLRPGVNSSDLSTLALHLGSLLVIAADHEGVRAWLSGGFEALARMDEDSQEGYQRISALAELFEVVLSDALDARTETYLSQLTEEDAADWASRLGPVSVLESGLAQLRTTLLHARGKVLPMYAAWARRQLRRYQQAAQKSLAGQDLVARVSKAPAAFFARAAVQLCTADNVQMWLEERLAHLVVFDPIGRRMAGMALLYVQPIPEIDRTRASLVIRAINPTDEMLASCAPESIVDSFFAVAEQIAEENRLACVAFPAPGGMHLMSNRVPVEKYLKARYVQRARVAPALFSAPMGLSLQDRPHKVSTRFFAYEVGQELVQELYVVWRPGTAQESPRATVV